MLRRLVVLAWSTSLAACATSNPRMQPGDRSGNSLFAPEIVAAKVMDAYQAVLRLRPDFLRWRGPDVGIPGQGSVRVFLDDVELGGPESLRQISLDQVTQIRFVTPAEAAIRFGAGKAGGGVILVSTARTPNEL